MHSALQLFVRFSVFDFALFCFFLFLILHLLTNWKSNIRKFFEKLTFGQMIYSTRWTKPTAFDLQMSHSKTLCLTSNFRTHTNKYIYMHCIGVYLSICLHIPRWTIEKSTILDNKRMNCVQCEYRSRTKVKVRWSKWNENRSSNFAAMQCKVTMAKLELLFLGKEFELGEMFENQWNKIIAVYVIKPIPNETYSCLCFYVTHSCKSYYVS